MSRAKKEQGRKPSLWDFQHVHHQGITEKEERDRDTRYAAALGDEVSRWVIQAYATLTFKTPRSVESAMHAAKAWLKGLESLGPGNDLFALLGPERGYAGNLAHIEVLIGGLLPRYIRSIQRPFELDWILHKAAQRWVGDPAGFATAEERLSAAERTMTHGRVTVEKPRSRRAVAHYVTKQAFTGEWDIVGHPLKRRRKRKQEHNR